LDSLEKEVKIYQRFRDIYYWAETDVTSLVKDVFRNKDWSISVQAEIPWHDLLGTLSIKRDSAWYISLRVDEPGKEWKYEMLTNTQADKYLKIFEQKLRKQKELKKKINNKK